MVVYHEICTVARNVEISSFTQKLYFDIQNPAILSGDLVTMSMISSTLHVFLQLLFEYSND